MFYLHKCRLLVHFIDIFILCTGWLRRNSRICSGRLPSWDQRMGSVYPVLMWLCPMITWFEMLKSVFVVDNKVLIITCIDEHVGYDIFEWHPQELGFSKTIKGLNFSSDKIKANTVRYNHLDESSLNWFLGSY